MIHIKIDEILKEKNKTKYWLIKNIKGSFQSISKLINNQATGIKFSTLEKICEILECDIKDIIEIKK